MHCRGNFLVLNSKPARGPKWFWVRENLELSTSRYANYAKTAYAQVHDSLFEPIANVHQLVANRTSRD